MKLPLSWLNELVALPAAPDDIAHRLSVAGLEVENIERLRPAFSGVGIALVTAVARHPNADRLALCEVDAGALGKFQVVCGAPNVKPGLRAGLARVEARLGGTAKGGANLETVAPLEAAVIRGVRSEGMLCSARELGLSDDHSGILELPTDAPLGEDLAQYLSLEETVFDIAITPNRGDCLSILGLAREVAALYGARLRLPRPRPIAASEPGPEIEIHNPELCRCYAGLRLNSIRIGPSPHWMRRRLELCGMRAVNNVVDITNYVMLERGQPLHAFDFNRLQGGAILVRRAGTEGEFVTLDGLARRILPDDLMICDREGPIAIAGVMGGQASEVGPETTSILLESAWFEPMTVAKTARRLGLRSEASYRFERGVDVMGQATAALRAAELLARLAQGRAVGGLRNLTPEPAPRREIELNLSRMTALLGVEIPRAEVRRRLTGLEATVRGAGGGRLLVVAPSWRPDLNEPADLAEEIARVRGLEEIPATLPHRSIGVTPVEPLRAFTAAAKAHLPGAGLTEIKTIAFVAPEDNRRFPGLNTHLPVPVTNPLSAELSELRKSLLGGLLAALRFNLNRQASAFHAFEIAKVFDAGEGQPAESQRLAMLSYGDFASAAVGAAPIRAGFLTLKGIVEGYFRAAGLPQPEFSLPQKVLAPYLHPGKAAEIRLGEQLLGIIGELHPEDAMRLDLEPGCVLCELDFSALANYPKVARAVAPPPRLPAIRRDLALVVDRDLPVATIVRAVEELKTGWLESVELFDIYAGDSIGAGKKSVALALCYRDRERTLTDEEVNRAHERLVNAVLTQLNATLRQ